VWNVNKALLHDKALGPDGFSARFLQASWNAIKADIMLAFDAFWRLDTRSFHSINEALMTLIPKKNDVVSLRD
jgi:hypothetical protein